MLQSSPQLDLVLGLYGRPAALAGLPDGRPGIGDLLRGLGELERQLLASSMASPGLTQRAELQLPLQAGNGGVLQPLDGDNFRPTLSLSWEAGSTVQAAAVTKPAAMEISANGNEARRLRRIVRRVLAEHSAARGN